MIEVRNETLEEAYKKAHALREGFFGGVENEA